MDLEYLPYLLVAAVLAAGILLEVPEDLDMKNQGAGQEVIGEPGSEHLHAHLFFSVNGSSRNLSAGYVERAARAHFHADDNIIHVHAENVDLGYALRTLGVGINSTCLEFGLENRTFCASDGTEVGVQINGESVDVGKALEKRITQGDSVVVWFGEEEPEGFDRELPPAYQETAPGKSV